MKIKTYVVNDVSDAYPMIRNDLGQDAFILKTKPLKKGGIFGLFQKKQFEVVAAADDSGGKDKEKPQHQELQEQKRFEEMIDSLVPRNNLEKTVELDDTQKILEALKNNTKSQELIKNERTIDALSLKLEDEIIETEEAPKKKGRAKKSVAPIVEEPVQEAPVQEEPIQDAPKKRGRPKKTVEPVAEEQPVEAPKKRGRPKKSVVPIAEETLVEAPKKKGRQKKAKVIVDEQAAGLEQDSQQEVLKELSEVKGLIQAMVQGDQAAKLIPKLLEKWVEQLREHEVDEEVIQFIVKKVSMKHSNIATLSTQQIEQTFLAVIEQLFQEGTDQHTGSSQAFIALVGPTGVGKTTTIAKLAAAQVIGQRQKVGLLTTDTFRIAAVEQLKTYANILNVPFEVVDKANELVPAMHSLKGCDIVFMDSAGRNYLEGEYVDEINQYLRLDVPQENYLVLSMTTRWRDMRKIVEQMKSVPIDKLILTKWDETSCYGVALNMVYHYPYPLSYLCLGQGVPEDIMKADPKFMAKKLLGVDDSETGPSTSLKTTI
jgi:flagellar biosynthesis protein FlhF